MGTGAVSSPEMCAAFNRNEAAVWRQQAEALERSGDKLGAGAMRKQAELYEAIASDFEKTEVRI